MTRRVVSRVVSGVVSAVSRAVLGDALFSRSLSPVERLEDRRLMSVAAPSLAFTGPVRSYDGTGNNVLNAAWGSDAQALLRLAPAGYGDGKSTPAGDSRPSARTISDNIAAHPESEIKSATNLSAYGYLWGQFIDHDLDLTNAASPNEEFDIKVPTGDASFDPNSTGTQVIPLSRSQYTVDKNGVRQQTNSITAYIDGSQVYGSDKTTADALRTFSGGKLKTSDGVGGNLLPLNTLGLDMATLFPGDTESKYFAAGDVRANENVELTSLQTLFMREHNRLADQIAKDNPTWTDEQIYQKARKLVGAEIQKITYDEYLPALMGQGAIRPYSGYKPNVNAGISTEFSTAAFRLGHSQLPDDVEFLNNDGTDFRDPIALAQAFFNPNLVKTTGIDPLLKYLASSNSEEVDSYVVDSLRNFLFGKPGQGGLDLASLNIQRGRDHGLADYNATRAALGLPKVTDFSQITSDPTLAQKLKDTYGSVDNVDLWVGGLAEDHVPPPHGSAGGGSSLGPTFQRILQDQFTRTRDGDRYFYLSDLKGKDLQMVQSMSLSKIIKLNSNVTNIQDDVFHFDVTVAGRVFGDANSDGKAQPNERGLGGVTVSLVDSDGNVVQTVKTDPRGMYFFSDVPLGTFTVKNDASSSTASIKATKADHFDRIDLAAPAPTVTAGNTGGTQQGKPPMPPPPPGKPGGPNGGGNGGGATNSLLGDNRKLLG
jgi:hypothetical protein